MPKDSINNYLTLDYRMPQGVFTGIQVWDIEKIIKKFKAKKKSFKQELINQPWGHRSFFVQEPNGLVLGFYREQF